MATATAKMVISGEDRTKKAFNSVQNSLKGLDKSFGSLKAGLGAVVGVAGIGAFGPDKEGFQFCSEFTEGIG